MSLVSCRLRDVFCRLCAGIAIAVAALLLPVQPAGADVAPTTEYKDVDLRTMTYFSALTGGIDLNNPDVFAEYLEIMYCETYIPIRNNPFRMKEMQQGVVQQVAQDSQTPRELYLRIPTSFLTSGYNFDTQALDVIPTNHMKRVKVMELYQPDKQLCHTRGNAFKQVPVYYSVSLNVPVSLYRIPLQQAIAENVLKRLDRQQNNEAQHIIYATILIRVLSTDPSFRALPGERKLATMLGQVDAIDLYLDHERKLPFKRLNYALDF